jgi:hypothetical protein
MPLRPSRRLLCTGLGADIVMESLSQAIVTAARFRRMANLVSFRTSTWPSEQYLLQDPDGNGFSVAFIPGRLSDHNLLDDKYVYRLRMM